MSARAIAGGNKSAEESGGPATAGPGVPAAESSVPLGPGASAVDRSPVSDMYHCMDAESFAL